MENPLPAVTCFGGCNSAARAPGRLSSLRSMRKKNTKVWRISGIATAVMVHRNVIVLHLCGDIVRQIHREVDGSLWQQRLVDISVRHPDDLSVTVVKHRQGLGDVHRLSTFIQ